MKTKFGKPISTISTTTVFMPTKFGRMLTYFDGLLPIKSHYCSIMWLCKITWQTKTITSPTHYNLCPVNLAVIPLRGCYPCYSTHWSHLFLWDHETNQNQYISTTKITMATKIVSSVTYHERVPSIEPYDALVTWSCEITWPTKTILSPLPRLWQWNFVGMWLTMSGFHP